MADNSQQDLENRFREALRAEVMSGRPPSWPRSVYIGGREVSVEDAVAAGMAEPGDGSSRGYIPPGPEGDAELEALEAAYAQALRDLIYDAEYAEGPAGRYFESANESIAAGLDIIAAPLANLLTGRAFGPGEELYQGPVRDAFTALGLTPPRGFEHEGWAAGAGRVTGDTAMLLPALQGTAVAGKYLPQFTREGAAIAGNPAVPQVFQDLGVVGQSLYRSPRVAMGAPGAGTNTGAFSNIMSQMAGANVARPGASIAAEVGLSGTAGIGGEMAADIYGEEYRGLGEMAGGMGPFLAGQTYKGLRYYPKKAAGWVGDATGITNLARNMTPTWVRNLFPRSTRIRAEDIFERAASDYETAQENLRSSDVLDEANLPPALLTGDPGEIALWRSQMARDPASEQARQNRLTEANRAVYNEMGNIGQLPEGATGDPIENVITLMQELISAARGRAMERLAAVGPQVTREQASRILAQELVGAREASRERIDQAFAAIPRDAQMVDTTELKAEYMNLWETTTDAAKADGVLPSYAERFLHPEGDMYLEGETTLGNLYDFRTGLLRAAAEADKSSNKQLERNALAIADMVLKQMGLHRDAYQFGGRDPWFGATDEEARYGRNAVARQIDEALTLAREHEKIFNEGQVGRILRQAEGIESFGPEEDMVLDNLFGSSGSRARHNYDALMRALDGSPQARARVEDAVKHSFNDRIVDPSTNEVIPSRYNRWKTQWSELLSRLPELEAQLDEAVRSGQAVLDLQDRAITRTSILLNHDPDQFVESIRSLRVGLVDEAMAEVRRIVDSDPTGRALEGLRKIFNDYLLTGSARGLRSSQRADLERRPFLNAHEMRALLEDPQMVEALKHVYTDAQRSRINTIANTAERIQMDLESGQALADIMAEQPNMLAKLLTTYVAVRAGAAASRGTGGGQLMFSGRVRQLMEWVQTNMSVEPAHRLVSDAMLDPTLYAALLTRDNSPEHVQRRALQTLRAWAVGVAGDSASDAVLPDLEEEQ